MVSPSEWGPGAWELLHGIGERIGNHSNHVLIQDERNELRLTLKYFWALLPCMKCQKHYKEWIKTHNPDNILKGPFGQDLQDSIREWLYTLHENVNTSREIVSGLKLEEIKEKYSSIHLREKANGLREFYQRGLDTRTLKPAEWKTAWQHLDMLLRILS